MKTNKKLTVLALGCVASLAFGGAMLTMTTANAEANADKFEMDYGVQLALRKDAMRWIVEMGQNVYDEIVTNDAAGNVSLSFIVSSKAQFDKIANGEYVNIPETNKTVIEIPDAKIYKSGDSYYANAALTGLYDTTQSNTEVVAIAVITTENAGAFSYEYANFYGGDIENNVRKQYEVLQQVALDTREEAKEWAEVILGEESPYGAWFGTEEFPIVVDTAEKYDSFVTQINNGMEINMNVDLHTAVITGNSAQLDAGKQLPANTTKYHTVNFYNEETLLKTVTVKNGEAAIAPDAATLPKYNGLEAMNGGYVRGYKNGGWADASYNGAVVDISCIEESKNVYINWVWGDHTSLLVADWEANEPNTVFSYDTELGVCHVSSSTDSPFTRSFDTTVKVDGQRGTTKLYYENTAGKTDLYAPWKSNNWTFDVSNYANDYVMMDVYVDFGDATSYVWVRINNVNGTSIQNKTWGRVIVPVSAISNKSSQWFYFQLRGGASAGSIYLGKATIIPASEVIDLTANTGTYNIGNTTFTGAASNFSYNGWSTKGKHNRTPNDAVFCQKFNYEPFLINGELTYSHDEGVDGAVRLEFNETVSGMVYMTARNLSDNPCVQIFDASGSHKGTPYAQSSGVAVVDAGNGYKTYCFNFGTTQVKSIRLFTGYNKTAPFSNVSIKDFTVVK